MKYLMSWKPRTGGSGHQNETDVVRSLQVFSKWAPPSNVTFHQFLTRLDGEGGYAVVESDSPAGILEGPSKFGPWFEFTLTPVMDIMEGIPILNEAIEFRGSIS
jgi:hypothetical protein